MSDKSIAARLALKPGHKFMLVNSPQGYKNLIGDLPEKAKLVGKNAAPVDAIQLFAASRKELEAHLEKAKALLDPKGMLWVTYYKGTSKHKTDINRDSINAYARTLGMEGIAIISIDDDWSALRLKIIGA